MSNEAPDCLYEMAAVTLAFDIGQVLEGLLLDRSLEVARRAGCARVTPDHIRSCVDEAVFAGVQMRVRDKAHGTAEHGQLREGSSREAA